MEAVLVSELLAVAVRELVMLAVCRRAGVTEAGESERDVTFAYD
jgi:hypothetical protein